MNIVDPILFQCRLQLPVAAMCAPGAKVPLISYGRLGQVVRAIAHKARAGGLEPGQTIALLIEEPILHAAFILGLAHAGLATMSLHGPALPMNIDVDAVITDRPHLFESAARIVIADAAWTEGDGHGAAPIPSTARGGEDLCRISLTSGSTGLPKAVALSHDLVSRRIARYGWAYGAAVANCSRLFVDPSLVTNIGFLFWLHTLSKGGTVLFRGDDAAETMQAFTLYRIQGMVASPAALAEFMELYEASPGFPSSFEVVVSAGSLLPPPLSKGVRSRLSSHLICAYGATETHSVATAPAHTIEGERGAVGYVTPDMTVEIVDGAGNKAPSGSEGLVRVLSPVAATAYVGDPTASQSAFRDGWFYPGDIGHLTDDGLLVIAGREQSVLNLGGDKVSPERIEGVLMSFPGVRQAAVFSVPDAAGIDRPHAAIISSAFDEGLLRAHCERHLAPAFVPRRFLAVDVIPLTDAGKINRRRLAELAKVQEI